MIKILKEKVYYSRFKIFFGMLKTIDFVETKEGSKYVERKWIGFGTWR